ncbi:Biopolymer transport protein ExbB/TolQ (TolQ) (PDB:5SV0) [Commensalibacter communis]|uniref:Biopolymer transport protein ExbB n=1 Tax=Commensalibacter communis TaxID=2972786 RepID=A0A9W4TPV8_9PROT|nr:MotA/TolQ/ExbB proton channel family protein [Commensalibacter communis]CAI3948568.1 Biopolymer transport protein ExbB/TolQ (TolQ) (PDB:5SV0) [Commensalibacter communis]CAI3951261.1 Biopolymer transport protein ExbB/TolQ (TolQ) (PDB:5SV0) [Commensalibacter communis]CAI3951721.1 Biopolymer transport protein ExbB/TolQ (TolQ) (PDB:5SV0) [Commensalibacter communis]CAI3952873.1 Biopolymer transport protein ExbB/TolQ (TolQ) (PDB:5SV0) [Commensalibacter communis]
MSKRYHFVRYVAPVAFTLAMAVAANQTTMAQQPNQPAPVQPAAAPAQPAAPAPSAQPVPAQQPVSAIPASGEDKAKSAENPYGLKALWSGGDIVSRITLLILAIMSIGSWYVIVIKIIAQNRVAGAYKEVNRKKFWQQKNLQQSADVLSAQSAYRYITENGIEAAQHHKGALQDSIDLYSWVSMSLHRALDHIQGRLQSGLAFLGTVGSTAPFVGLFGTVWGIHHALSAISIAGQATLDKVAGPVGEALIMTAIGLATAVPAVLGYNFLVRRNKVVMDQARNFTADVQCVLIGGNPQGKNPATKESDAA